MRLGADRLSLSFSGTLGDFSLDAAFDAPMQGVTGLFGPSGSGKTTILRTIAGLQRLPGRFALGGDVWQDDERGIFRKPHRRPVGYVFQEPSLFPHLNVRQNLQYGADRAGEFGALQAITFDAAIALLGIEPFLTRDPQSLSGGERQRVAIGRALLSRPRLLLMDEPISALDRPTRAEILPYLEALHKKLAIPIVYVSHDMTEIERLADTLILIEAGRVIASGPLHELQTDPELPLLRAAGAAIVLEGRVSAIDEGYALTDITVPGGILTVPGLHGPLGNPKRLRIAASDVSFTLKPQEGTSILNSLPVRILSVVEGNSGQPQVNVLAGLGEDGEGARIAAQVTRKSRDALSLAPGQRLFAQIKSVALLASPAGPVLPGG